MRVAPVRYTRRMISEKDLSHLCVAVLGSGSSGNATLVSDGATTVLVDCGFSARETARRIAACGFDPNGLAALLVTHEHSDHVRGVEVFVRRFPLPVYASAGTARAARLDAVAGGATRLRDGKPTTIGTLMVTPVATSHDAVEPLGFRFDSTLGGSVGLATDTGVLTAAAAATLRSCEILAIESNHDAVMLEKGPYPRFLKNRISSHRGHLGNDQAAEALELLGDERLRHVIALHRSAQNNRAELVAEALTSRLATLGLQAGVITAEQHVLAGVGLPTLLAE